MFWTKQFEILLLTNSGHLAFSKILTHALTRELLPRRIYFKGLFMEGSIIVILENKNKRFLKKFITLIIQNLLSF